MYFFLENLGAASKHRGARKVIYICIPNNCNSGLALKLSGIWPLLLRTCELIHICVRIKCDIFTLKILGATAK